MQKTATINSDNTAQVLSKSPYRPEIDGLRALAVVAVIINHFNKVLLPSGYLGVDIFFVISGYVITSSLANYRTESLPDFFLGFYARRVKRLVPALCVFVAISFIVSSIFIPPEPALEFNSYLRTGIFSLFGLSNLYLFKQSTDYFASSTEYNIFTHTWSLGVEEQFYIVFPLLVWLSGFGRNGSKGERNLFWATLILSIGSLIGFLYLYPTNQSAAYFLMPPRIWELGVGCLLFLILRRRGSTLRLFEAVSPILITAALVTTLFLPLSSGLIATIIVVFLTAWLLICLKPMKIGYGIFTHKNIIYIGQISYSLYLWHWAVLCISRWTIGLHWWSWPLQVALMLALAVASYRYVETPLRRAEWTAKRWRTIVYGIGAAISTTGILLLFGKVPGLSLYTGRQLQLMQAGVASLTIPYSINGTTWKGQECILTDNSDVGKHIPIIGCTLGDFSNAKRRVLVIGNSFSTAFVHSFDKLVKEDNYAVMITSSYGASPVKEIPNNGNQAKASDYYWSTIIPGLLSKLGKGDWLFLANDMSDFSKKDDSPDNIKKIAALKDGIQRLSTELYPRGVRIAVLDGIPLAREANCKPVNAARQWFNSFSDQCDLPDRKESLLRRKPLDDALFELQRREYIKIVDLFMIFCPKERCTYNAYDGSILYRDEFSHPSIEAAKLSSGIIRDTLIDH
jgi:peptidoglycan/LPS O-acetylase OafA/YrhL